MAILTWLITISCLVTVAAWKPNLPRIRQRHDELFLRSDEDLRSPRGYEPTHRYKFPDMHLHTLEGDNLHAIGLQTTSDAIITLHDSSGSMHDLRLILNMEDENVEDEWTCSVQYMHPKEPYSSSVPCYLQVFDDSMQWFTLLTSDDYIALYEPGWVTPVVELSSSDLGIENINFNKYTSYSLSSNEEALWDLQGLTRGRQEFDDVEVNPVLEASLDKVYENLLDMKKQIWRCDEAKARKKETMDKTLKRKFVTFDQKFCFNHRIQPYRDSIARLETILLINGWELPNASDYDVKDFFMNVY